VEVPALDPVTAIASALFDTCLFDSCVDPLNRSREEPNSLAGVDLPSAARQNESKACTHLVKGRSVWSIFRLAAVKASLKANKSLTEEAASTESGKRVV
jgi:hypothetical protein